MSGAAAVREYQAHTCGTWHHYQHPLGRFRYTDGARTVAEECGAYWLLDLIGSYQPERRVAGEAFQLWRVIAPASERGPWAVECWTDTPPGGSLIVRQEIEYSDFPRELCQPEPFKLYLENGVLMLPEER